MKKLKKIILIAFCLVLLVTFSANSKTVIESIKNSLIMCYNSVIPSLFPFLVLSEFLISVLSTTKINPTVYLFICGLLTGFPNGTKGVCKLYSKNKISKESAVKLLYCTANASPAYIVSFIGMCILGSKSIGYIILISQFICSIMCAIGFGAFKKSIKTYPGIINLTETACNSITGSVSACLNICGYIIFFGIFADIISKLICSNSILIGILEITRGVSLINLNNSNSIILISFLVGFSGLSIIMQCINYVVKYNLPIKPIIISKFIYSFLMPAITYCLIKIVPIKYEHAINKFSSLVLLIFIIFLGFFLYIFFDKLYKRLYNK